MRKGQSFSQIMFTKPDKRATREHIISLVENVLNDAAEHHALEVQAWNGKRDDHAMGALSQEIKYQLRILGQFVVRHADEIGIRHSPRRRVNGAYAKRWVAHVNRVYAPKIRPYRGISDVIEASDA